MDRATVIGIILALGGILGGNALEGGHMGGLVQPTAAMIVGLGAIGAAMTQFPMTTVLRAFKALKAVFNEPKNPSQEIIEEIVKFATIARKDGILALEPLASKASDPFLGRAINMAVDGVDAAAMRDSMEASIHHVEEEGEDVAKVYEAVGGYAPTVGIIGAVLGLIHVMGNLSDIGKVGEGIAVAFVATIYGVGIANLFALPFAGKLKIRTREAVATKNIMLEGALAIQQGMNPKLVRDRLLAMAPHEAKHGAKPEGAAQAAAA
ncbi:MAG: flagellar motor protein [Myxococcales bacterium]